jgi:hypothetical protein
VVIMLMMLLFLLLLLLMLIMMLLFLLCTANQWFTFSQMGCLCRVPNFLPLFKRPRTVRKTFWK